MRTDVKVGLICAVIVVLCVVLYFVTHSSPPKAPANTQARGNDSSRNSLTQIPPAPTTAPSSAVSGGFIGLPGATIATTSPATAPATTLAANPTTPDMGPSPSLTSTTGTGTFGSTSLSTTTTGTGMSTFGSVGAGTSVSELPVTSVAGSPALRGTLQVLPSDNTSTLGGLTGTTAATTYKIQRGDMLGTIAKKFNVSLQALKTANPGVDSNRLKIDAVIKIPAPALAASGTSATSGNGVRPVTASSSTPAAAGAAATTIKPGSTYTIKKGDTLTTIAKAAYGSKTDGWKKIFQANRSELNDPDLVPVGAKIVIPQ